MDLNSDTFMQMLSNKEQILQTILADVDSCGKNFEAFEKLEALYDEGREVNPDKALRACAKSLRHVNEVNRRMLMLLLVYVSGSNYNGDTTQVLMKLGRGQDALREMMRQKMGGHTQ